MDNTEETLDFEQKHKEDLQRLRGFRLLDDDFMSKVFEDKACAEFLLQIILQRHDLKVQSVQGQYDIKNLQGRSIRLDILAVDSNNRIYNIEIQRSDRGADAKRARYNSSLIDANITEAGDKYDALTETYVIFITESAAQSTITIQARKGRASYLGERSIGHQDPGATSVMFMMQMLALAAKE